MKRPTRKGERNIMHINFDRFDALVAETGITKSHLCRIADKSRYYLRERKIVNYVESDEGDSNKRTKNKINDENYLPKDKKEKSKKKPNKSILDRQDLFFKMKKCLEKQKISSNN